ncbi:MAG: ABC transporter permease subunit [Candidatus Nitrosocosmicus sp.]
MTKKDKIINFNLIMWVLTIISLIYILYPLVSIFTFVEPQNLLDSITGPKITDALFLSILSASISTMLIAIIGIPFAFWLARYRFPGSFLLRVVVIIPLVLPPLASGALLLGVFGPQSIMGRVFPGVEFTQSLVGVIIAQTYVAFPFMVLASLAAFESVDETYEKIARVLGKKKIEVFVKISLPLAKKGILIGFVMTWIRAVGELGATIMMAYNPHTISIQIFEDNAIGGLRQAIPGIILVIFLSVAIMFMFSIIMKRSDYKATKNVLNLRLWKGRKY